MVQYIQKLSAIKEYRLKSKSMWFEGKKLLTGGFSSGWRIFAPYLVYSTIQQHWNTFLKREVLANSFEFGYGVHFIEDSSVSTLVALLFQRKSQGIPAAQI